MKIYNKRQIIILLAFTIWIVSKSEVSYVSSAAAGSNRDGSYNHPYCSIAEALASTCDTIMLERGSAFFEKVHAIGKVILPYGKGDKPQISGLKTLSNAKWENGRLINGSWTRARGNIWRCCLSEDDLHYGGYLTHGSSFDNNIGSFVDIESDTIIESCKKRNYSDLKRNFDFWQPCPAENTKNATPEDFDYVYLYSESNPNNIKLGVTAGNAGIRISDGVIRNVSVRYWGFGISAKSNVTISDCLVENIGGMIQRGYKVWVTYGNGIEFYVGKDGIENCLVKDCLIRKVFDAGTTIQGSSTSYPLIAKNVVFSGNRIENCCQSYEEFLRGSTDDDVFKNCVFENNISIDAGINTGFRYCDGRYKRCHILSNSFIRNTHMIYRNNSFVNGNFYCAGAFNGLYHQGIWEGNICYIQRGQDLLGNYRGTNDVIKLPMDMTTWDFTRKIDLYKKFTGDRTTEFKIMNIENIKEIMKSLGF